MKSFKVTITLWLAFYHCTCTSALLEFVCNFMSKCVSSIVKLSCCMLRVAVLAYGSELVPDLHTIWIRSCTDKPQFECTASWSNESALASPFLSWFDKYIYTVNKYFFIYRDHESDVSEAQVKGFESASIYTSSWLSYISSHIYYVYASEFAIDSQDSYLEHNSYTNTYERNSRYRSRQAGTRACD